LEVIVYQPEPTWKAGFTGKGKVSEIQGELAGIGGAKLLGFDLIEQQEVA
jgi:hypothetical protein